MSAANQLPHLMTVAEFLAWQPPDGSERWELVEGIPRAMNAPSDRHAVIHGEVLRLIGNHLADARPDCRVGIGSGLRPNDYNYRIPDLAVACGPAATDNGSLRAPVLVIEILSPSNEKDTWANVAIYTTIPSIQEILVIDSVEIEAHVLRRPAEGAWPQQTLSRRDDTVTLESVGFTAPLAAFYRTMA
jgi:Uma2 family endonuclease